LGLKPSGGREPLVLDVVKPLCMFVAELPDYVRNTRRLSGDAIRVPGAILAAKEPVTLLFKELPSACGMSPFPADSGVSTDTARAFSKRLKGHLDELRGAFDMLLERLRDAVREEFDIDGPFEQVRQKLADRADSVALMAGEPRVKALCLRLSDVKLNEASWLESLGSLLAAQPPMRWKDEEEEMFRRELHVVAARFKGLESIGFQNTSGNNFAEAFRLSLTKNDGNEVQQVVYVEKDSLPDINALASEIEKLVAHNRSVGMAALSRVVWSTLSKD
jgi:hypothetical protein